MSRFPHLALAGAALALLLDAQDTREARLPAEDENPLLRGWLQEVLDQDPVAARRSYAEAAEKGSRADAAIALSRLAETERVLGTDASWRALLRRMEAAGARAAVPRREEAAFWAEVQAARRALEQAAGQEAHEAAALKLRQILTARPALLQTRPYVRVPLETRLGPPGQQTLLVALEERLRTAERTGQSEQVQELREQIADLRTARGFPQGRPQLLLGTALEIVRFRLDGKPAAADRLEETLRQLRLGARRPRLPGVGELATLRPGAAASETQGYLRRLRSQLDRLADEERGLAPRDRETIERLLGRLDTLLKEARHQEIRELIRPFQILAGE
ncbi:MAG: hypothetical protein IT458_03540 [Planctomycetes bacterium]|nr:hypothetical protein [Planctomycetota bacterium]